MKSFKLNLILACIWAFTIPQNMQAKPITIIPLVYEPCTRTASLPQRFLDSFTVIKSNWTFIDANSNIIGTLQGDSRLTRTILPIGTRFVGGNITYVGGTGYSWLELNVANPSPYNSIILPSDADICSQLSISPASYPKSNCRWDVFANIPICIGTVQRTFWTFQLLANPLNVRNAPQSGFNLLVEGGTRLNDQFVPGGLYSVSIKIVLSTGRQIVCNNVRVNTSDGRMPWYEPCRNRRKINSIKNNFTQIYPNPALNAINIESDNANISKIEIYDTVGKLWLQHETPLSDNVYLEIDKLKFGLYFVKIYDENGQLLETQKLLIQK
jgi:Secretion system C-terminal sorting domain